MYIILMYRMVAWVEGCVLFIVMVTLTFSSSSLSLLPIKIMNEKADMEEDEED